MDAYPSDEQNNGEGCRQDLIALRTSHLFRIVMEVLALLLTTFSIDHFDRYGRASRSLHGLGTDNTLALTNRDEAVRRDFADPFDVAVRPAHCHLGRSRVTEAEMQSFVIRRQEAGLSRHLLGLQSIAISHRHPRSDRT